MSRRATPILLHAGYERAIVGFDLRESLGRAQRSKPAWPSANVATLDREIWRGIETDFEEDRNGVNLFDDHIPDLSKIFLDSDGVLVSFDYPLAPLQQISKMFGLKPMTFPLHWPGINWHFVGFDLVDIRTQASALYSFDWSEIEFQNNLARCQLVLNYFGLVENEHSAVASCALFDEIVPEHAPFAPCGVWSGVA